MTKYVIITAGGKGKRMGPGVPKQFIDLDGRPLLMHTIERFYEFDPAIRIVLVLADDLHNKWKTLCERHNFSLEHSLVKGGAERFYSVKNGLLACKEDALIAVHDAVRPLVSLATIKACFDTAGAKGNAIPVISTPESLREKVPGTEKSRPLDRNMVKLVQTPQVFRSDLLHKAYDCGFLPSFTDDATVVEQLGITINLVEGNRENIKITTPHDLLLASTLIKEFNKK